MSKDKKIQSIVQTGILMFVGLFFLKLVPMYVYGFDIKFDASAHITIAIFILYFIWFFIDQNKTWRLFYFIFSLAVISIISIQRILVDAHNDVGLLLGLIVSLVSIMLSRWDYFKNKLKF